MWKSTELILRADRSFRTLELPDPANALYAAVTQHIRLFHDLQVILCISPDNGLCSWGLNKNSQKRSCDFHKNVLSIENGLIRFIKIGIRKTVINWLKLVTPVLLPEDTIDFCSPGKGVGR